MRSTVFNILANSPEVQAAGLDLADCDALAERIFGAASAALGAQILRETADSMQALMPVYVDEDHRDGYMDAVNDLINRATRGAHFTKLYPLADEPPPRE